ncbi:hypothetical protein P3L10_022884 [Capsicum annuum]
MAIGDHSMQRNEKKDQMMYIHMERTLGDDYEEILGGQRINVMKYKSGSSKGSAGFDSRISSLQKIHDFMTC